MTKKKSKDIRVILPKIINEKESNFGKQYLSIKAGDGLYYSVWDNKLFKYFVVNKMVAVRVEVIQAEENLVFNNIISVEELNEIDEDTKKQVEKVDKEIQIAKEKMQEDNKRLVFLENTCNLVQSMINTNMLKKGEIEKEIKKIYKVISNLWKIKN